MQLPRDFATLPNDCDATQQLAPAPKESGVVPRLPRRDTPLAPTEPRPWARSRATLTLLTGMNAGHSVTIGPGGIVVGRGADADLIVDDANVSRRHARFARNRDGGISVEDLDSTNGTFVGTEQVRRTALREGEIVQLGPHRVRFALVDAGEETLFRQLYEASVQDPLTHLYNRKYFGDRLVAEVSHARRSGAELSLLMVDVDALKQVNDRCGHLAGDRALCIVAARMKRAIRVEDVLARYGGDEFVILAPGTGDAEVPHLADHVRRAVEDLQLSAQGHRVRITLSIGAASLGDVASTEEPTVGLVRLADERLYEAKAAGGNCVRRGGGP